MKPRKGKKDYSEHAYHCLVRATDGTRKLSTVVQARELARFQESYTTIMRVGGCRAVCDQRAMLVGLCRKQGAAP